MSRECRLVLRPVWDLIIEETATPQDVEAETGAGYYSRSSLGSAFDDWCAARNAEIAALKRLPRCPRCGGLQDWPSYSTPSEWLCTCHGA